MEVEGAGAAVEGVEAETPTWIKRVIRAPWRYFRVRFTFDDVAVRVDAPLCKTVRAVACALLHRRVRLPWFFRQILCENSVVWWSIDMQGCFDGHSCRLRWCVTSGQLLSSCIL